MWEDNKWDDKKKKKKKKRTSTAVKVRTWYYYVPGAYSSININSTSAVFHVSFVRNGPVFFPFVILPADWSYKQFRVECQFI